MPRLTEQEQQEIIRFLEADKPLPDKYRFLLFEEKREVELVWNGKTNEVCNVALPFQIIEQVDEPRAEKTEDTQAQLDLFSLDERGRQLKGWTNKLIWGDNKLILSSLKNGPMRREIEEQGGIKLIYIDPPFDVGADFSMDIAIGEDTFTKRPSILEEIAYRDTWGKGADSFIAMLFERLILMRDLLAINGSIYVHCDWRMVGYIRLVLDEVFGREQFNNIITWRRGPQKTHGLGYGHNADYLLYYAKTDEFTWNIVRGELSDEYLNSFKEDTLGKYVTMPLHSGRPPANVPAWKGVKPPQGRGWAYTIETLNRFDEEGRIEWSKHGVPRLKRYLDEIEGAAVQEIWVDVKPLLAKTSDHLGYPTQKPEALLERVLNASSNEGDLVADFFCGSGTTAAVAEKLGRKWIAADLGKFAIHTTRKRMIEVQRQLKANGDDYRAFEILNLGKYERQLYIGVNPDLREEEQRAQRAQKEADFINLIFNAYRAERLDGFATFHGKKAGRFVAVGPVNLPVTRLFVEEVILECLEKQITRADILGFEFEMGLFPNILDEARAKGIDIAPKYIPAEVFDKRAVEKNQVAFHDVSFIEVKPHIEKNSIAVELTDFSVFYSQDSIAAVETALKDKSSKIVVERGQIIKVSKDTKGIVSCEVLTEKWTDWIDYWAVDFDFESKREIVRIKNEESGEWEEKWTGDYIFENEWQSFRTKKDRSLELKSVFRECTPGRRKLAVKVVDIFGTDTMTVMEVKVGTK